MKFGLLGKKLTYSKSKIIHEMFFENMKLDASYELIEVDEIKIHEFMKKDIYDYDGMNVTIPHKKIVMQYLDEISPEAKELGSVNTIKNINGKLYGYNTDINGFESMMNVNHINFENKEIIILGTGATSQMIEYFAKSKKAKSVKFVSRNKTKANYTYEDDFSGDILINTTPMGVDGINDLSPVNEDVVKKFHTIIDINYNPYRTKILRYGIYNNKKIVNGMYMLVAQAIKSESIWNDIKYKEDYSQDIFHKMGEERNIVLIGMPGCGKSSIGKILKKKTNKEVISLDSFIEESEGKTIPELFEVSEHHFRDKESIACKKLASRKNIVIDTGGGVVVREKNMDAFYKNAIVIFIDRPLMSIIKTMNPSKRPLLKGNYKVKLEKTYRKRIRLYRKYAEIKIKNNNMSKTSNTILKIIER